MSWDWDKLVQEKQAYLNSHEFIWHPENIVTTYQIETLSDLAERYPAVQSILKSAQCWPEYQNYSVAVYDGNYFSDNPESGSAPEQGTLGTVVTGNAKLDKGLINLDFGGFFLVLGDLSTSLIVVTDADVLIGGVTYASHAIVRRYNDSVFISEFTKTPLWIHFDGFMEPGLGHDINHKLSHTDEGFEEVVTQLHKDALICSECISEQLELSSMENIETLIKHKAFQNWLETRKPCDECDDINGVWDVSDEYWIARLMSNLPITKPTT